MGSGMGGGLLRTGFVVLLVLLGLAGVLWIGSATIKPPPARPAEAYADISWLAPQNRTFPLDAADPEVVVLISGVRGWPTNGAEVTFSIVSGPASLRGTEAVVSDVRGTARTEHLELTGAGTVVIEVGIDLLTSRFEFEVTAP